MSERIQYKKYSFVAVLADETDDERFWVAQFLQDVSEKAVANATKRIKIRWLVLKGKFTYELETNDTLYVENFIDSIVMSRGNGKAYRLPKSEHERICRILDITPVAGVQDIPLVEENNAYRADELRRHGVPFLLQEAEKWIQFTKNWILSNGNLNSTFLIQQYGEEVVPVTHALEGKPITGYTTLRDYIMKYWSKSDLKCYMNQWQFTTAVQDSELKAHKSRIPLALGEDLLEMWLDGGINPFQYLSICPPKTHIPWRTPQNGLATVLAPVHGTQTVSLRLAESDKEQVWEGDIKAGDVLFIPNGLTYQTDSKDDCITLMRMHLDGANLMPFIKANHRRAGLAHTEILWKASMVLVQDMKVIEKLPLTENQTRTIDSSAKLLAALRTLSKEIRMFDPVIADLETQMQRITGLDTHSA